MKLTHLDKRGTARMVNINHKIMTKREAVAQSIITMKEETLELITARNIKKGDVISTARIAGIMAAKQTANLIPMCHPLPIDGVRISITVKSKSQIQIKTTVSCVYKTGAEMEALTAASIAALTIYDMCKAVDKDMTIGSIELLKKTGGKSGKYEKTIT